MTKKSYLALGLFAVAVLVFWNLANFIYSTYITGTGYNFSLASLATPMAAIVMAAYVLHLRNKK